MTREELNEKINEKINEYIGEPITENLKEKIRCEVYDILLTAVGAGLFTTIPRLKIKSGGSHSLYVEIKEPDEEIKDNTRDSEERKQVAQIRRNLVGRFIPRLRNKTRVLCKQSE